MRDAPAEGRRRVPGIKLAVPELPPRLISRPRLMTLLKRSHDSVVTLVNAPAGAGKTLLLAEWVRRSGGDTVWVTLDVDDNEDRRFWSALLDALSTSPSVTEDGPLSRLETPVNPSTDPAFLARVVNALDDLASPVLLVLDDVHELSDPQPLHGLEFLLRHRPRGLRFVLSTRDSSHLPLARLRLAGEVSEIRAEDLVFSADEARALLDAAGIQLEPGQFGRVLDQTGGWAAGLRLAALSMSRATGPRDSPAHFAVTDRAVAQYLVDEVLNPLPEDRREFLRAISICEQVSAELAAHLSGRADAGALLDALAAQTSLVLRAGRTRRHRIHPLLRAHLRADLVRQAPDRAADLHGEAACWFAAHNQPARALAHAGAAGSPSLAMSLMRRYAIRLTLKGHHVLVRGVLDMLGARQVAADSLLALASALLRMERGELHLADRDLGHSETAWPHEPSPELVSLRGLVRSRHALITGDVRNLVRLADGHGAEGAHLLDPPAMLERGTALVAAGHRAAAREQFLPALDGARECGQDYLASLCRTMLAGLAAVEGDYGAMVSLASVVNEQATRRGWRQAVAEASALLSYGALLRADPAECLRHASRTRPRERTGDPGTGPGLNLVVETLHGAAEFELGDRLGGARRIHGARGGEGSPRCSAEQIALCAVLEHRTALLLGWGEAAAETRRWGHAGISGSAELELMRARAQLATGRRNAAAKTIQPVLTGDAPPVLPWSVIEAWLLYCEFSLAAGDDARALRALRSALAVADDLEVSYPVVFAAPEVLTLLTSRVGKLGTAEPFAARVLALRRGLHVPPMAALTAREQTVLRLLPMQRSFDEIAEDLTVSANTVKTHVRAIYTKLGVTQRRDAVAVALARGLLENDYADQ